MMPAYAVTIQECIKLLDTAMMEAAAELPDEIMKEHAIKNHHSPAAWNEVYHKHMGEILENRDMVNALLALARMIDSQTQLQAVVYACEERNTPNLKLSKMRPYD